MHQGINDTVERRSKKMMDKSNSMLMLTLPSALLYLKVGIRAVKEE